LVRFGVFELDLKAGELRRKGSKIKLQEQPFQILRLLLERPGDVVTHDEIIQVLWPNGTIVEYEHSVKTAVKKLRQALGDDADAPRYVETLPRRGYRFIYPVDVGAGLVPAPQKEDVGAGLAPPSPGDPPLPIRAPQAVPLRAAEGTPPSLIGRTLSHYRVLGEIGKGGMGVVYRAEDIRLGRPVGPEIPA
jgi:DNA-binding winged helix-turn-helix (wHTH) protein